MTVAGAVLLVTIGIPTGIPYWFTPHQMANPVLADVKVGDKLYVGSRLDTYRVETVGRITPTGRVITQTGTFNPDGRLRGNRSSWRETWARPATEDDIASIYRAGLVSKIQSFQGWNKLSPDDLKTVAAIIAKYSDVR